MPKPDPLRDLDGIVIRLAAVALTLTTAVSLIDRECHELIGNASFVGVVVGTVAGLLVILVAARIRS